MQPAGVTIPVVTTALVGLEIAAMEAFVSLTITTSDNIDNINFQLEVLGIYCAKTVGKSILKTRGAVSNRQRNLLLEYRKKLLL